MEKNTKRKKVVIIGAGFGGLATAIRLQANGYDVTIYDKQEMPGGQAVQLKKNGYTFDLGPSLITAPQIIEDVFKTAGKEMKDYLELIPLDPFYRIYFHDKTFIDYTGDAERMKEQIAKFNKKDAGNYDSFMNYAAKMYKVVITDGLGAKPFMKWIDFLKFVPRAASLFAIFSTYGQVSRFFRDAKIRFTFSFHPLFIGGNPFRTPALFLMIPYLERHDGVWFTKGGMFSVVEALVKVFKELGGKIEQNSEVQEILVEDGTAKGIRLNSKENPKVKVEAKAKDEKNGEVVEADIVVSNAHSAHTYGRLIDPKYRRKNTDKKIKNSKYSMSSFLLYIGVKKKYPTLLHHTLILSERYKELIYDLFDRKILPDDFSMYLHVPTRTDSDMAPANSESMYLLIPVPNLDADVDWSVVAPRFRDKILEFMEEEFGLEDFRENIEVCEMYTPADFERERNNYLGACWSLEPSLFQIANFRPHNRSEDIRNLYLTGVSTHPGGGVPGVLLTAETTAKVILQDQVAAQSQIKGKN